VGDYAIFARKDRNSADWYVGGVNGHAARDVTLALDFLDPAKSYTATVYKDGEGATYETDARHRIAYATLTVKKGDTLPLWLAPGGGAAIRLHPGR
jgi:alpha-glucosidase